MTETPPTDGRSTGPFDSDARVLSDHASGDAVKRLAPQPPLVIAISSRALFDLEESHHVFAADGIEAYAKYQIDREDVPLAPGAAFDLARKLLALNDLEPRRPRVDVILLSRNSADTGLRVFKSIEHHNLPITRAVFTRGVAPYRYVRPFGAQLFLSTHASDVQAALMAGCAAATIWPSASISDDADELRFAFDGDSVLFSDESERVYKSQGLQAFADNEVVSRHQPLSGGPFKGFLSSLHGIQAEFGAEKSPIRTALVTARGAPAHERVIRTLRAWNVRIDEAMFLGGMRKSDFLAAFGADIFFDDQREHCEAASNVVATGHVPHGVANE
ncbi:MAG: 5'-nucleotidase [Gammaproteobacteria bacterium]|nr:5'-nucleotidase [Gammaproteobacteria bacterium]